MLAGGTVFATLDVPPRPRRGASDPDASGLSILPFPHHTLGPGHRQHPPYELKWDTLPTEVLLRYYLFTVGVLPPSLENTHLAR